jgi:hypothetical protein
MTVKMPKLRASYDLHRIGKIGDHVEIVLDSSSDEAAQTKIIGKIRVAACNFATRRGWKFSVQQVPGFKNVVRVWRVR